MMTEAWSPEPGCRGASAVFAAAPAVLLLVVSAPTGGAGAISRAAGLGPCKTHDECQTSSRAAVESCASLSFSAHSVQQTSTTLPRSFTLMELESSLQSQAAQVVSFIKARQLLTDPVSVK